MQIYINSTQCLRNILIICCFHLPQGPAGLCPLRRRASLATTRAPAVAGYGPIYFVARPSQYLDTASNLAPCTCTKPGWWAYDPHSGSLDKKRKVVYNACVSDSYGRHFNGALCPLVSMVPGLVIVCLVKRCIVYMLLLSRLGDYFFIVPPGSEFGKRTWTKTREHTHEQK